MDFGIWDVEEEKLSAVYWRKVFEVLSLTRRQRDVAKLILKNKTTKEIGALLNLSPRTVDHYVEQLKSRMGCSKKVEVLQELMRLYYEIPCLGSNG